MVKWIQETLHDEYVSLLGTIAVILFIIIFMFLQESITNFTDKFFKKKD